MKATRHLPRIKQLGVRAGESCLHHIHDDGFCTAHPVGHGIHPPDLDSSPWSRHLNPVLHVVLYLLLYVFICRYIHMEGDLAEMGKQVTYAGIIYLVIAVVSVFCWVYTARKAGHWVQRNRNTGSTATPAGTGNFQRVQ